MDKNVVYKFSGKSKRRKVVFESSDIMECFRFVIDIVRKERAKLDEESREIQNFLDFGIIENGGLK